MFSIHLDKQFPFKQKTNKKKRSFNDLSHVIRFKLRWKLINNLPRGPSKRQRATITKAKASVLFNLFLPTCKLHPLEKKRKQQIPQVMKAFLSMYTTPCWTPFLRASRACDISKIYIWFDKLAGVRTQTHTQKDKIISFFSFPKLFPSALTMEI